MSTSSEPGLAALQHLLRSSHLTGPDDLPQLVVEAARLLGAGDATVFVADYDQVLLVPLVGRGEQGPPPAPVDSTLAGRAFSDVVQHVTTSEDAVVLWAPLVDGTDRLGVLQLLFPPGTLTDEPLRATAQDVASLVAELVVTRTVYGDLVEKARRPRPMTLPAELQWRLLPPLTFVSSRAAVSGVLAPTAEIAGDSFDYASNGDTLHVAVLDAMGHGLEATLLVSVAVASMRTARREDLDLADTARRMDAAIAGQFGPDRFVTGIVGELDTATGWWRWLTCGHPPALLIRGGQVVKQLDSATGPPLGLELLDDEPEVGRERLEPGDRLVLYTDGVVEARAEDGTFFGTERLAAFVTRQAADERPVAESLRRLNLAVLAHQQGTLQDDATTVIVEWRSAQPAASTVPAERAPTAGH